MFQYSLWLVKVLARVRVKDKELIMPRSFGADKIKKVTLFLILKDQFAKYMFIYLIPGTGTKIRYNCCGLQVGTLGEKHIDLEYWKIGYETERTLLQN